MKRKVKWVPVYETEDFLENGKKAKPIGRMRDPDATKGGTTYSRTSARPLRARMPLTTQTIL